MELKLGNGLTARAAELGDVVLFRVCRFLLWLMFHVFFSFRAYNSHLLPRKGGVLLVSNHQSFLDPINVGIAAMHRPMYFMARRSLFRNPVFGRLISAVHAFPVTRRGADSEAVKTGIANLRKGRALLVFGEGTRTRDGSIGEIHQGPAMMASRANVPIVPVVIDGAFEAWPRTRKLPRPGYIRVVFGEQIPPPGKSRAERTETTRLVNTTLQRLQRELRRTKL